MELLEKHKKKRNGRKTRKRNGRKTRKRDGQNWEERREKKAEERRAKWEDTQRLERQGDEIMEMVRRHEEEEEEERWQAEGMSAGDEYRMMLVMAERHARATRTW